jgi:hypothetical protein
MDSKVCASSDEDLLLTFYSPASVPSNAPLVRVHYPLSRLLLPSYQLYRPVFGEGYGEENFPSLAQLWIGVHRHPPRSNLITHRRHGDKKKLKNRVAECRAEPYPWPSRWT